MNLMKKKLGIFFQIKNKLAVLHILRTRTSLVSTQHHGGRRLVVVVVAVVTVITRAVIRRQFHDLGFLLRLLVLHFLHLHDVSVAELLAQARDQAHGVDVYADQLQPVLAVADDPHRADPCKHTHVRTGIVRTIHNAREQKHMNMEVQACRVLAYRRLWRPVPWPWTGSSQTTCSP